jgi:pentatricopeptide repeat protein
LLLGNAALAQSAAQIRSSAAQIAAQIDAKKASGSLDMAAQSRAIEDLGKLTLQFIELSEQTASRGSEKADRDSLLGVYQAIAAPLDGLYDQSAGALDRMARKIMDEDGDLEALYESPEYRQGQTVGAQALYYLNWLRYYGARLFDGAKRKEMLEQAQRGFSEFTGGEKRSELQLESVLGRGLSALELGNMEVAGHDLKLVADDPQVSAERRSKARLALLDGYVRHGKVSEAVKLSEQMLGQGGRDDNLVRYLRARALLDGAKKSSGAEAERYRQQAMTQMDQLRKAGGVWAERAAALLASAVDDPKKWAGDANSPFARWELAKMLIAKNDYKQATPLLEELVKSNDPALQRIRSEAHYFLGLARFQAGQLDEAAKHLDAAMQDDKAAYAADVAYLRFKAREALAAKSPEAAKAPEYVGAVEDYVKGFPSHKFAYEGLFRLGELRQAERRFAEAIDAYGKVKGDAGFELRALFGSLQCRFERLAEEGIDRNQVLAEIAADLPRFDQQSAEVDKRKAAVEPAQLNQMRAKVTLMKAVYSNLQPTPNPQAVADLLDDLEKRHPDQNDLFPQVARLRLLADQALGRFARAEAEVRRYGPRLLAEYGQAAIEELAVGFIRQGARSGDAQANQQAQQVALRLYELLPADDAAGGSKLTLAKLYENTGDTKKAAALYQEVLDVKGDSLTALRGAARLSEADQQLAQSLGYWQQLTKAARPGDAPWYEGQYQSARLTAALGKPKEACAQLDQLKPAMPGLSDVELRGKLDDLYRRICR